MTAALRTAVLEITLIAAIFLLTNIVSAVRQKQNTYNQGTAWEWPYLNMAAQFTKHLPIEAEAPYVYRVATPYLAAQLSPHDLFRGFRIVNITGSALAAVLLAFWLRGCVGDWRIRVLLVTLFLIQWDAPPRLVWHSPVHTDAWYFVFVLAGLIVARRDRAEPAPVRLALLCALAFTGTLFREITLLFPLAILAAHQPFTRETGAWRLRLPSLRNFLPFAFGIAALVLVHRFARQTDNYAFGELVPYSFSRTVLTFLYEKPVIGYAQAWLLAYGPVLFIVLFDWRKAAAFLAEQQWLAVFLLAGAGLGFFGGTDSERLLYWSMPVVYVLLGRALENQRAVLASRELAAVFVIGQLLTSRILWTTPDYPTAPPHTFPILQQFGSDVPYLDLFSYHGFRMKEFISIVQFTFFGIGVLWWMRARARASAAPIQ